MVILKILFWLVPFVVVFCGLSVFSSVRKHLLNVLLWLEFVMLGVFCVLVYSLSVLSGELYFMLYFLAMVACEGALGLSILVSVVWNHGNNYFNKFSFLTMLKFLISTVLLMMFAGSWEVVHFFLFVLSFLFFLSVLMIFSWENLGM